jgi:hypothetical protein
MKIEEKEEKPTLAAADPTETTALSALSVLPTGFSPPDLTSSPPPSCNHKQSVSTSETSQATSDSLRTTY